MTLEQEKHPNYTLKLFWVALRHLWKMSKLSHFNKISRPNYWKKSSFFFFQNGSELSSLAALGLEPGCPKRQKKKKAFGSRGTSLCVTIKLYTYDHEITKEIKSFGMYWIIYVAIFVWKYRIIGAIYIIFHVETFYCPLVYVKKNENSALLWKKNAYDHFAENSFFR